MQLTNRLQCTVKKTFVFGPQAPDEGLDKSASNHVRVKFNKLCLIVVCGGFVPTFVSTHLYMSVLGYYTTEYNRHWLSR